jgi:hypothetical protein
MDFIEVFKEPSTMEVALMVEHTMVVSFKAEKTRVDFEKWANPKIEKVDKGVILNNLALDPFTMKFA